MRHRYDCVFSMLKNLEERNGRKPPSFSQKDIPNIRKIYIDKWLRWNENKAEWKLYI